MKRLLAILFASALALFAARTWSANTDNIDVGNQAVYNFTTSTSYTVAMWVYHTNLTGVQRWASKQDVSNVWAIRKDASHRLEAVVGAVGGGGPQTLTATTVLSVNTWYFVALVRNVTSDTLKLYYATAAGSITEDASATDTTTVTHGGGNLVIGKVSGGTTETFIGRMAYASIFTRALTVGDLESLKRNQLVGPSRAGLWPMNGNSPEPDLSGSDFAGTVTGATVGDNPPVGPSR